MMNLLNKLAKIGAGILAGLLVGANLGYKLASGIYAENEVKAANAYAQKLKEQEIVNIQLTSALAQTKQDNASKFESLNYEINKYRTELNSCNLSNKWVRIHNQAAECKLPKVPPQLMESLPAMRSM
jgi:hypothetical protein